MKRDIHARARFNRMMDWLIPCGSAVAIIVVFVFMLSNCDCKG